MVKGEVKKGREEEVRIFELSDGVSKKINSSLYIEVFRGVVLIVTSGKVRVSTIGVSGEEDKGRVVRNE